VRNEYAEKTTGQNTSEAEQTIKDDYVGWVTW